MVILHNDPEPEKKDEEQKALEEQNKEVESKYSMEDDNDYE